jgi:hypothetical protein
MTLTDSVRRIVLATTVLVASAVTFMLPRLAQWREYHQMADTRTLAGVSNALNVLSNIPFAIVGIAGLAALVSRRSPRADRRAYATFFTGVALTAAGSAYYHLAPDNFRLVWDRLPMTVAFMGLLTAVLAERVHVRFTRALLPLVIVGAASVLYWYWSEARGQGDLRFYALVQFGSLAVITLTLLLYRGRGTGYLIAGLFAYALSKICETYDAEIFAALHIVSGHTLKHLFAATGAACVLPLVNPSATAALIAPGGAKHGATEARRATEGAGGRSTRHRRPAAGAPKRIAGWRVEQWLAAPLPLELPTSPFSASPLLRGSPPQAELSGCR